MNRVDPFGLQPEPTPPSGENNYCQKTQESCEHKCGRTWESYCEKGMDVICTDPRAPRWAKAFKKPICMGSKWAVCSAICTAQLAKKYPECFDPFQKWPGSVDDWRQVYGI